jgi:putative membrane protein
MRRTPPALTPPWWRRVLFLLGMGVIYAVLQTHFEYLSQHMFFLNRLQHLAMHHVGPFLLAIAWPGEIIARGMPVLLRRVTDSRAVRLTLDLIQQPVLAAFLFVGLVYLWLIPSVHFRAMLDPQLYALMNWSMVIDGILFWFLVMDPRARPPARLSFPGRILLAFSVQIPQIAAGALIGFAGRQLYPYYDLCGRIFPAIGADLDQQIGGSVVWVPGGMMSAVAVMLLCRAMWLDEEKRHTSQGSVAPASISTG